MPLPFPSRSSHASRRRAANAAVAAAVVSVLVLTGCADVLASPQVGDASPSTSSTSGPGDRDTGGTGKKRAGDDKPSKARGDQKGRSSQGSDDRYPAGTRVIGVGEGDLSEPDGDVWPAPISAPRDERPNIVLFSADDMRADEIQFMPNTRTLLGDAGLTFTEALTPHPLCCPARAELLTGQFAQNNGVRSNFGPYGGYDALDPSKGTPTTLSAAGYNTAFVGKHLNAANIDETGRNPGWTIFDPTLRGYSDYYGFTQYNNGEVIDLPDDVYYTEYLAQRSTEYAKRLSSYDAPFFMWVSHFGPHLTQTKSCGKKKCGKLPPLPSPADLANPDLLDRDRAQAEDFVAEMASKPNFNEADVSDKQAYVRDKEFFDRDEVEDLVAGRIASLRAVDQAVAKVVRQLKDDGELDNTYLVFITDNGYLLGQHRHRGKILGYEDALRTPMLVRGPGVEAGSRTDEVATLVDLPATFFDIADATPDLRIDGISLLRTWQGRGPGPYDHRDGVLIQAGAMHGSGTGNSRWYFRGVRTHRYTYMKFVDGFVELYDRKIDPYQVTNLATSAQYRKVKRTLAARTRDLSVCSGVASCNRQYGPVPKVTRKQARKAVRAAR